MEVIDSYWWFMIVAWMSPCHQSDVRQRLSSWVSHRIVIACAIMYMLACVFVRFFINIEFVYIDVIQSFVD